MRSAPLPRLSGTLHCKLSDETVGNEQSPFPTILTDIFA